MNVSLAFLRKLSGSSRAGHGPSTSGFSKAKGRALLFIDEPNVALSLGEVHSRGKDLDYKKLKECCDAGDWLVGAYFDTGYGTSQLGMRAFFRKLSNLGLRGCPGEEQALP